MRTISIIPLLLAMTLLLGLAPQSLRAEPPATQPDKPPRPEMRPWTQDDMRKFRHDSYKLILKASEEEMKVILPRVEKVQGLQFEMRGQINPYLRRKPGRAATNPANVDWEPSDYGSATADLTKALRDSDASADEIKKCLDAARKAHEELKTELAKAQQELRDILNVKQEAQMFLMGMLE